MVMVCIIAISAFFILLNSSLAWRVDITYLFFLNLFCWSILHVGLNGLIRRNRGTERERTTAIGEELLLGSVWRNRKCHYLCHKEG